MPFSRVSSVLLQADGSLVDMLRSYAERAWAAFSQHLVGEDLLIQAGSAAGAVVLALLASWALKPLLRKSSELVEGRASWIAGAANWLRDNAFNLMLVLLLWAVSISFDGYNERVALTAEMAVDKPQAVAGASEADTIIKVVEADPASKPVAKNYILLRALASIATLWLVSSALPRSIRSQAYYKTLFFVLATLLVLNLLGVWHGIRDGLDSIHILPVTKGQETRVTALTIFKGIVVVLLLIPLTMWFLHLSERRVKSMSSISPALQMLIVKVVKALMVVLAILFAISSMGIDLSALAVLGGAVGLGLGFGFQKVISNLISGVILLADRSIKPGDVIEVDDTYGWINKLSARYVSVITRDGMEHLIPNETLITEKVTNWSFSDDMVRVKVPFGVSYNSDVHLVMRLAVEVGKTVPRVISEKDPVCWMMGYGDNSVDFELRVWIRDPANGLNNLRSAIYVKLWDAFKEHNIEIPFPQRDLHIRDSVPLNLRMEKE